MALSRTARQPRRAPRDLAFRHKIDWHESLAQHHVSKPDSAKAAELHTAADEFLDQAETATITRKTPLEIRRLIASANATRHFAIVIGGEPDYAAHVKHILVAAQLRATHEGRDITEAAVAALTQLCSSDDEKVTGAAMQHPYFDRLVPKDGPALRGKAKAGAEDAARQQVVDTPRGVSEERPAK